MINIWEYANKRPRIRLKTKDGTVYVGDTLMVYDAEETDDEEDSIAVELDSGKIVSFFPSEISEIEEDK